ncbi:MAG: ATP-binding protein [Verrucomicrobia bacterium]|nr:ATP-binding protein [Verrucomicrobiota bacterium]
MSATTDQHPVNAPSSPPEAQRVKVRKDIAGFEAATAHYPERAREAASFVFQFMNNRCNGSPALVAAVLKKLDAAAYENKENYIYQVTTGRYFKQATGAQAINALVEIADHLRRYDITASQAGKVPFNEKLSVWKDVRDYIDRKRARDAVCKFGAIEGATGTGKTAATKHYQLLNNHLTTVRFEAPSHPSLARFMCKLGACYNIAGTQRTNERILSIEENVNDTRCIIIENVQKLYNPKNGANQAVFSYLQELQDDTGCTIIMTWTPVFRKELTTGKDAGYFAQFVSRWGGMEDVLVLDRKPAKTDLRSIAEQFEIENFDACFPILKEWGSQAGPLRILYERCQKAKLLAGGKAPTVDHLEAVSTEPISFSKDDGTEEAAA